MRSSPSTQRDDRGRAEFEPSGVVDAGVIERPVPPLARRIDLLWSSASRGGQDITRHEFFPDAGVNLVFRHSPAGSRAVLLGPTAQKASVERATGAEYLGVRFLAGQAPRLADVRSSDLTDGFVEVTQIGGVPIDAIAERLRALPDLRSRRQALAALVGQAARSLVDDERCRTGALLLEARRGQVRVDALAAELGLHVRTLERRFLDQFGMTPKRMIRLVRLRHVLEALHAGGFGTLADLAHACGYADQPHLIRDFKALTGRLPGDEDAARSRVLASTETRLVHRYRP